MSVPTTLPSIDSNSSWHSNTVYTLISNAGVSGFHVYGASRSSGFEPNHEIKVSSTSPYTWSDHGSNHPLNQPNENNGVVTLSSVGYTNLYKFSTSYWDGLNGGGTSTEEVFVPNAKIVYYSGLTGRRFEQRGYPSASYELIGSGATHTWTLTSQSNNLQHHISGLSAGIWYLWQDSVLVATLGKSKVFCNFW